MGTNNAYALRMGGGRVRDTKASVSEAAALFPSEFNERARKAARGPSQDVADWGDGSDQEHE